MRLQGSDPERGTDLGAPDRTFEGGSGAETRLRTRTRAMRSYSS
jgi:hypothetical protein